MSSGISYSGKVAQNTSKGELLSPSERHKKQKNTDLTRGGNFKLHTVAHGLIIEAPTHPSTPGQTEYRYYRRSPIRLE